ncbi:uncharacterized protein DUF4331 [Kribbella sp. VKM Ac-2527]|uniref:Uncharacterized protein DUF4331 n=1 Tax=Kribbella caucasensis TaxID=2512215 RepID=A0A4R6JM50_9ACTN|nr:DUF4331 domain-containing protein [Kribbella sp. VKM Ac-2527]TDO35786.1 uncharacterized protein DUF4331 [Kribbella sp. VKM Ac-2527]
MSSHREAPEISKDPVADNTDVYAFVSPDKPGTVTLIANFIPFQNPYGGPNFYEFGDDVLYQIHISNRGDAKADISYQFRFQAKIRNKKTFLYNTGPINSLDDPDWNRPQYYSVTRVETGRSRVLARNLAVPPVNIGPRSTPKYAKLAQKAVHTIGADRKVFAGQRADGFFADLGSIFDLGTLRPFQMAHLIPSAAAMGVNGLQAQNVHTIALQVPIRDLTRDGSTPKNVLDPRAVIGVYASASRQQSRMISGGETLWHGPYRQVSRLGNPLFNEVIVPMAEKDKWNSRAPKDDKAYAGFVTKPELAGLLPVLYPGVFPRLAAYKKPRADLAAILLTGIPQGVVPGFQNFTGPVQADMLRLNVAVPPAKSPNPLGLVAGDAAGFPNGRRVFDDVVTVELRAVAGITIPLVDPSFTPDDAAGAIKDGTSNTNSDYLTWFPYLGVPAGGYQTKPGIPAVS